MANIEVISNLAQVKAELERKLEAAGEDIGQRMETHAKLYITAGVYQSPEGWYVRTGNLRNSISHAKEKDDDGNTVVAVGSRVEYAPWVELGTGVYAEDGQGRKTPWRYQDSNGNWHTTSGIPPRPYIRPAVERHIEEYQEILKEKLEK